MQLKADLCLRDVNGSETDGNTGRMHIIVSSNHAQLADQLEKAFAGDSATRVIVDRRYGERRNQAQEILTDLRKADRRQGRHNIIEAVIDL